MDVKYWCNKREPRTYTPVSCLEDKQIEKKKTKKCLTCNMFRDYDSFIIGYDYTDLLKTKIKGIYRGNKCYQCRKLVKEFKEKDTFAEETEVNIKNLEKVILNLATASNLHVNIDTLEVTKLPS